MKISNVVEIFDNGEFVTIVTGSNSAIHLPVGPGHSITIHDARENDPSLIDAPDAKIRQDVTIDLFQN